MSHSKIYLILLYLIISFHLIGQETRLVLDLAEGAANGFSDDVDILNTSGDYIVIMDNGKIITSNGLKEGTNVISDLGTNAQALGDGISLNEKLYFIFYNTEDEYSIVEFSPESGTIRKLLGGIGSISNLLLYKDNLYCELQTGTFEYIFAKVNIEEDSFEKIFDVDWFGTMRDVIVHNDMIYSLHWKLDGDGAYLSRSDGTPGNVDEFSFLHTGDEFSKNINMTSAGDNLFFFYYSDNSDYTLYVSDGTDEGTIPLQKNLESLSFFDYKAKRAIGTLGNKILFIAERENVSFEQDLWISDGTIEGTCLVKEGDEDIEPKYFTNYNDKLYFYGTNEDDGFGGRNGLIESDGTKANTGSTYNSLDHEDKLYFTGWQVTKHLDRLFFFAENSEFGPQLYSSEGDLETIKRESSFLEEQSFSELSDLTTIGDNLFFIAKNATYGRELYVYSQQSIDVDADGDGFNASVDCDDDNLAVNPGATEIEYNGIDDDCNSETLDDDLDRDGFLFADDCDDTNPEINPDQTEIVNSGVDEDCNGESLTSATHQLENSIIKIYPNPTNNEINVEASGTIKYTVRLYNTTGQLISTSSNSKTISVGELQNGTYLLEIEDSLSGARVVERIIKF